MSREVENQQEFSRAVAYATTLRHAINGALAFQKTLKVQNKLVEKFMQAIKLDSVNVRGSRVYDTANCRQLNCTLGNSSIRNAFLLPMRLEIVGNATMRVAQVTFSRGIVPMTDIKKVPAATHAKLSVTISSVNFVSDMFPDVQSIEQTFQLSDTLESISVLATPSIPAPVGASYFMVVSLSYYQEVNGTLYHLESQSLNYTDMIAG